MSDLENAEVVSVPPESGSSGRGEGNGTLEVRCGLFLVGRRHEKTQNELEVFARQPESEHQHDHCLVAETPDVKFGGNQTGTLELEGRG